MKKLIVVAILAMSLSGIAQEKKNDARSERTEFTPQQRTELQVKKLTLELDLSAKQQKEISEIVAKQQVKRESRRMDLINRKAENKKLTADEKFVLKSKALDERIALKSEMKKILTPEQLVKWEKKPRKHLKMQQKKMKQKNHSKK